jgi:hypothetical protein
VNNLAKLIAAIGLLLIGISAVTYVFNDIAQQKKAEADAEEAAEFFGELLFGKPE